MTPAADPRAVLGGVLTPSDPMPDALSRCDGGPPSPHVSFLLCWCIREEKSRGFMVTGWRLSEVLRGESYKMRVMLVSPIDQTFQERHSKRTATHTSLLLLVLHLMLSEDTDSCSSRNLGVKQGGLWVEELGDASLRGDRIGTPS